MSIRILPYYILERVVYIIRVDNISNTYLFYTRDQKRTKRNQLLT